ncbi:MAG: 30S ribosomal protein S12 methylthiotransferase RimO [Phycisphaeraceae bacterium]|nr:30S ribosomal protein S12 methylthiotransferase RimO [Phycisphaerales bacterium]QOJ17264.1 MAG: 30S ribosomal protein S12 methylthiotransferase RimO [Phycisphaeraceae bacterium]
MPASAATTRDSSTKRPDDAGGVSRVAFVSLGCPKNLVDSEKMLGTLAEAGLTLVSEQDSPDAIVINTCGFLEASKEESLGVIRDAIARKERGELKRVVVAGCLVQRHRARMLDWAPGIDAMIGVFDRDHVVEAVAGAAVGRQPSAVSQVVGLEDSAHPTASAVSTDNRQPTTDNHSALSTQHPALPPYWIAANALVAAKERGINTVGLTVNGADGKGVGYFEDDSRRFRLTPRHWAYLRVSEGCNQRCAFCTIPSIRGKMRSKPMDRIIAEARALMQDGAFEINLIGQDTTSYGYDIYGKDAGPPAVSPQSSPLAHSGDLIGLLTALNDVASDFGGASGGWMRLMYVYPTYFTDAMIDAIARLPNIVKYIDIPLQHMSDPMLRAMRRNITARQQIDLLNKLRERIPGLAIRTTFITGFPGETEEDHRQLVDFIGEFQFDMLGVFRYSREDGTPAGTMDLDPALHVPDEVKAEREREIMLTQQTIAFENMAYLAEERCQFDVLIDGPALGEASSEPIEPRRSHTEPRSRHSEPRPSGSGDSFAPSNQPLPHGRGSLEGAEHSTRESGQLHHHVGRAYFQAPQIDSVTHVQSIRPLSPGELVRCTIVDSRGYDLVARPTEDLERRTSLPLLRR